MSLALGGNVLTTKFEWWILGDQISSLKMKKVIPAVGTNLYDYRESYFAMFQKYSSVPKNSDIC